MTTSPDTLPIDDVLGDIVERLREDRAVVVEAPPGAGKSTRVPAALLDAGGFEGANIVLLEPRRVAARAIASRIAQMRGSSVGDEVGWQIRFDRRTSNKTRLTVVTEGILTARIQSEPFLESFDVVILDEFHERSIHTDLAIGYCRELLDLREDLRVVVMSATLDSQSVADYLGCRAVTSRGRLFDVELRWVDRDPDHLGRAVRRAVDDLIGDPADDGGDILVFLPGVREIDDARGSLRSLEGVDVLPLHGRLSSEDQDRALRRGARRKIIVSTNIAETSLTIDGVTAVIDSGLVRIPRADPGTGFDRLETRRISLASAAQRAGRAGRLAPGRAVRLWPSASEFRMPEFDEPEVQRIDLTAATLDVVAWSGEDPAKFRWFERPSEPVLSGAVATLRALGALERGEWNVTTVGRDLSRMPLHPRIGRFLAAANDHGVGEMGARVAACLAEADWVTSVSQDAPEGDSDAWVRASLLDDVAAGHTQGARAYGLEVSVSGAKRTQRIVKDLKRFVRADTAVDREAAVRRSLLSAYGDRIAVRRSEDRFALTTGGSVVLGHESVVRDAEMILVLAAFGSRYVDGVDCGIVRQAAAIEPEWIQEELGDRVRDEVEVFFDDRLERLVARRRRRLDDLILKEEPVSISHAEFDPQRQAETLADAVRHDLIIAFGLSRDDARFVDRMRFVRRWVPEVELPAPDDIELLTGIVWGKTSFAELRKLDFVRVMRGQLRHDQFVAIEEHAPDRFVLPSGRGYRIDYGNVEAPVLAGKLQHFFGMSATPRIALGRVPLLLHLLAPNQRPAQITTDLASFWKNTYPEVRKELRARYPKHDWPETPPE